VSNPRANPVANPEPGPCGPGAGGRLEPDDAAGGVRPRKSKAGPWRALVLVLVHVAIALHVAHWWNTGSTLSPLEPSESMEFSKQGVVNAGAIFFAITILSTSLFGRFFCGWACHLVAVQDACRWILEKLGLRPRPVRLGVLGLVPWILCVYMFFAPLIFRALNGLELGVSEVNLSTNFFWKTFPGWAMASTTLVVCGGLLIYFLGAKGFCTYGCPYGALFGIADQFAPLRIRVTDACNGCGHCTAVCTSNVRVHQEVRDWKSVVDPGCMKCLDCVSVCPTDALYVGFGAPALGTSAAKPAAGSPSGPGRDYRQVLLQAGFLWASFALLLFHGGEFDGTFAVGLAVIALAIALVFSGKSRRVGGPSLREELLLAALFLAGLYAFRGYRLFPGVEEGVPLLLAAGLAVLGAHIGLLVLRLCSRPDVTLQWHVLVRGGRWTRSGMGFLALALPFALLFGDGVRVQLREDLERARAASRRQEDQAAARAVYDRGVARAAADDIGGAIAAFEEAVRLWPEFLPARENLAGAYCAAGRFTEGIAQFRAALAVNPADAATHLLLGRALEESGDLAGAEAEWLETLRLDPGQREAHLGLARVLARRGDRDGARRHREAAQR
jgi:tetratricopeptide (TPR) repeat protein/NAD-dependent dihydropyrimidine dehydrogenase PreA subunit